MAFILSSNTYQRVARSIKALQNEQTNHEQSVQDLLAQADIQNEGVQIRQVLEVYDRVMKVYAPSQQQYQAAVQAGVVVNGYSTTTNI